MRILVTGGAGFLGSYLLPTLSQDHEVKAITRKERSGGQWMLKDIFAIRPQDLEPFDLLIHMAGATPGKGFSDDDFFKQNELATSHLVEQCEKIGLKRLIYISTTSVESKSDSTYAKSKRLAEKVVRSSSLEWTILRPSYIYGLDGNFWESMFRGLGLKKRFILLKGSSKIKFQPVYVNDVVQVILSVVASEDAINKIYLVTGPGPISYLDFYRIFKSRFNRKFIIISIPKLFSKFLGKLSKRLAPDNVSNEFYDITNTKRDLRFTPTEFADSFDQLKKEISNA